MYPSGSIEQTETSPKKIPERGKNNCIVSKHGKGGRGGGKAETGGGKVGGGSYLSSLGLFLLKVLS